MSWENNQQIVAGLCCCEVNQPETVWSASQADVPQSKAQKEFGKLERKWTNGPNRTWAAVKLWRMWPAWTCLQPPPGASGEAEGLGSCRDPGLKQGDFHLCVCLTECWRSDAYFEFLWHKPDKLCFFRSFYQREAPGLYASSLRAAVSPVITLEKSLINTAFLVFMEWESPRFSLGLFSPLLDDTVIAIIIFIDREALNGCKDNNTMHQTHQEQNSLSSHPAAYLVPASIKRSGRRCDL